MNATSSRDSPRTKTGPFPMKPKPSAGTRIKVVDQSHYFYFDQHTDPALRVRQKKDGTWESVDHDLHRGLVIFVTGKTSEFPTDIVVVHTESSKVFATELGWS